MTVIVGLITKKGVYIGADSLGSNGSTGRAYKNKKIFTRDEFLIGVCGSYRVSQVLQYNLSIPSRTVKQSTDEYLHGTFSTSVRNCLKEHCAAKIAYGVPKMGGDFLFAYEGRLFIMQNDFSILETKTDYHATGSGGGHAEASLYTSQNSKFDAKTRVKLAIECANDFVIGVNNDINIEFQEKK